MEGFIGLAILGVAGYLIWHFVIAAFLGLRRAGRRMQESLPTIFEKFWISVGTGIATGFVVGLLSNGTTGTATAAGVALAKLVIDIVRDA